MIFKCDSLEISIALAFTVKDIFPANNSSSFVIRQPLKAVAQNSGCRIQTNIPEKFNGDYYLRDDEDTFRIVSNVPAGLSLPRRANADGSIELSKGQKKIVLKDKQFEALMAGGDVSQVCANMSVEDRRIIATGLTTEELNKLQ